MDERVDRRRLLACVGVAVVGSVGLAIYLGDTGEAAPGGGSGRAIGYGGGRYGDGGYGVGGHGVRRTERERRRRSGTSHQPR